MKVNIFYTLVMSFVLRQIFQRFVTKYDSDYIVRGFSSNLLQYILLSQLTPC